MDVHFEFSAPGTPQQNGVVKRPFTTLYSRVRSMLNSAKIKGEICKSLKIECGKTATNLDGIL